MLSLLSGKKKETIYDTSDSGVIQDNDDDNKLVIQTNGEKGFDDQLEDIVDDVNGDDGMGLTKPFSSKQQGDINKNKRGLSIYEDKSILSKSLLEVEQKFKSRELQEIEVYSVSVFNLISAHKFTKNTPWCKCAWGGESSWTVEYQTPKEGDSKAVVSGEAADWSELGWKFILPRNEHDRHDLIFVICSQDVIIGRYALLAKDFAGIPDSTSGYFEVKGEIRNVIGLAGYIKLICRKGLATRPSRPKKTEAGLPSEFGTLLSSPAFVAMNNSSSDAMRQKANYVKVSLKIISIAVADLKNAHTLELNSPFVKVVKGTSWQSSTDILLSAGNAAKWPKLRWKVEMDKGEALTFTVTSVTTFIGKIAISFDDIVAKEMDNDGMITVLQYITNGATISGKIRVKFHVKYPEIISYGPTIPEGLDLVEGTRENGDADVSFGISARDAAFEHGEGLLPVPSLLGSPPNFAIGLDRSSIMSIGTAVHNADALMQVPPQAGNKLPVDRQYQFQQQPKPIKRITTVPFKVRITSIAAVDLRQAHLWSLNSPRVNAVCGAWGAATEVVPDAGASAHWLNLNWNFVVYESNFLRFVVWSKDTCIGQVNMKPYDLLNQPLDAEGNAELFLMIINKRFTTGKLKVTCTYDYHYEVPINIQMKRASAAAVASIGAPVKINELPIGLPVMAHVMTISLVDLKAIHKLSRNSPRVKLICDRKSAMSKVSSLSGSNARWNDLRWPVPVLDGSFLLLAVTSQDVSIGKLEIPASQLIGIPPNPQGLTEINKTVVDENGCMTGKIQIVFRLEPMSHEEAMQLSTSPNKKSSNPSNNAVASQSQQRPSSSPVRHKPSALQPPQSSLSSSSLLFSNEKITPQELRIKGLVMEITILEIDSFELRGVHTFTKNSPFISVACGKFTETTAEIAGAGDNAFWTNLKWVFRLKDDTSIRVYVGSKDKAIGTTSFTSQNIFANQADASGLCKIVQTIFDGPRIAGQVKLTYINNIVKDLRPMSAGLPIATTGGIGAMKNASYQLEDADLDIIEDNGDEELLGNETNDDPFNLDEADLSFPLIGDVRKIVLTDMNFNQVVGNGLTNMLSMGMGSLGLSHTKLQLKLEAENWTQSTPVVLAIEKDNMVVWDSLDLHIPFNEINSQVTISLFSDRTVLGTMSVTAESLLDIPRDNVGITEAIKSLVVSRGSYSSATGRLSLLIKLASATMHEQLAQMALGDSEDQVQEQESKAHEIGINSSAAFITSQPSSIPRPVTINLPPSALQFNPQQLSGTAPIAARSLSMPESDYTPPQQPQAVTLEPIPGNPSAAAALNNLPKKLFLSGYKLMLRKIAVINVQSAHRLKTNSLMATIVCGEGLSTTKIVPNAGSAVKWDKLDTTFVIHDKLSVRVVISSRSKNIGAKSWTLEQLLNESQSYNTPRGTINMSVDGKNTDLITVFGNLRDGDNEVTGNIKMSFKLQHIT